MESKCLPISTEKAYLQSWAFVTNFAWFDNLVSIDVIVDAIKNMLS